MGHPAGVRFSSWCPCIFCDNNSGSEEHLWPDWVHEFIRKNGIELGGLRVQEGTGPEVIEYNLEKSINTVCDKLSMRSLRSNHYR
jgi:hypothetical protein